MRRILLALLLCVLSVSAYAQGAALPSGYLSVIGNQIVDGTGTNVRIASWGYNEPLQAGSYSADMGVMRAQGVNAVRWPWYDATLCPGGTCNFTQPDAIVAAAAANGMKVIFDHHGNEDNGTCDYQQTNGLWFDSGAGTNGTDGCPTPQTGTSYARFKANWVAIASHYAGNSTVIGFDLHNEPTTYGNPYCCSIAGVNWGSGGPTDILAMFNDVGGAINAVNPGVLIIAECPINGTPLFNGSSYGLTSGVIADCTLAHTKPVTAAPGKVVYSIHDYTCHLSSTCPDNGSVKIAAMNNAWGYLEANNYAPVWIGEMGANLDNSDGYQAQDTAWVNTLVSYVNGTAAGGPTFSGVQQPMSTDWWNYGDNAGQQPNGTCNVGSGCSSFKANQKTLGWYPILYTPSGAAPPGTSTTWNPSDASGYTLSGSNLIGTSTVAAGSGVRSSTSKSSGKWCAAVVLTNVTNNMAVGISTSTESLTGYLGGTGSSGIGLFPQFGAGSEIYVNGTAISTGAAGGSSSGDTVTIEIDVGAQLVWFKNPAMVAAGYTWNNSTTANPETGVGGLSLSFISPPYFIEANSQDTATVQTANFTPGSGCTASFSTWDTVIATGGRPMIFNMGSNDPIMRAFARLRRAG